MSPPVRSYVLGLFAVVLWQGPANAGDAVQIAKRDCHRLVAHVPAPGVAYVPGTDVRGRPVTPADLGAGPRIAISETIEIDIGIDLQDRFGFPANADSFETGTDIGVVKVAPDGRASFNGQPLQDEAQVVLTQRCRQILSGQP